MNYGSLILANSDEHDFINIIQKAYNTYLENHVGGFICDSCCEVASFFEISDLCLELVIDNSIKYVLIYGSKMGAIHAIDLLLKDILLFEGFAFKDDKTGEIINSNQLELFPDF